VGVVVPDAGATLAVKVTLDPTSACADETVSVVLVCAIAWKVAVTDWAEVIATEHAPVPVQAPLHPVNSEPAAAASVNVTEVPLLKLAEQVPGQLIPTGVLVTTPLPDPDTATVNGKVLLVPDPFRYAVSMAKSVHVLAQFVRLNVNDVTFGAV